MVFFIISIFAGVLTVLAPCILPLLPIVIGASEEGASGISKRAVTVIGSLSVSVILFTLLLKATTLFISIPQQFWTIFSGGIIILVGLAMIFPDFWAQIPYINKLNLASNKVLGEGYQKQNSRGDMLIGLALGPVFTTCSPTYLFIIATILPASFGLGLVYLIGFTLGLAVSLLLIAYFGQRIVNKITSRMQTAGTIKKLFGGLIILVGLSILTGYDKKLETYILDSGYGATIQFEDSLLERFSPNNNAQDEALLAGNGSYETITLAGGCFWCTEAYFQEAPGVITAISGYAGGDESDARYLAVAKGTTKHRESVQVTYDPQIISTEEILDIYWSHIDPTNQEGQFADRGFQYTTAIFYHSPEQEQAARDSKMRLEKSGVFDTAIATKILPFSTFFEAEKYHQDYYKKSSEHYERYKKSSGRQGFVEETWAKDAALLFLSSEQTKNMNDNISQRKNDYNYTEQEIQEMLKNLDPLAYHVVAEGGTESPFNNAYWDNKADGIYVDKLTGKPLFSSTHKYDSGTGWPSFWRTIKDDSVTMHEDNSLSTTRTEIRSDAGHVGHVFEDGPEQEGGRRFCTNSASLKFVPKESMIAEGYQDYLYLFSE
jgi:peptide methionine sulfoxide reductase msrA/msrB